MFDCSNRISKFFITAEVVFIGLTCLCSPVWATTPDCPAEVKQQVYQTVINRNGLFEMSSFDFGRDESQATNSVDSTKPASSEGTVFFNHARKGFDRCKLN